MSFKKSMVALAAVTYGLGSVAASAAPLAQSAQPVVAESEFGGGSEGSSSGTFLAVFALVAIIAGIVIAADGGNDDPLSP